MSRFRKLSHAIWFRQYLEEHILPDAKSVIAHIDNQYGVHYSVSGVTDLLHRLGFSYKKPTHVPGRFSIPSLKKHNKSEVFA